MSRDVRESPVTAVSRGGIRRGLALGLLLALGLAGCGRASRPLPPADAASYRVPIVGGHIQPSQAANSASTDETGILSLPTPEEVIAPKRAINSDSNGSTTP